MASSEPGAVVCRTPLAAAAVVFYGIVDSAATFPHDPALFPRHPLDVTNDLKGPVLGLSGGKERRSRLQASTRCARSFARVTPRHAPSSPITVTAIAPRTRPMHGTAALTGLPSGSDRKHCKDASASLAPAVPTQRKCAAQPGQGGGREGAKTRRVYGRRVLRQSRGRARRLEPARFRRSRVARTLPKYFWQRRFPRSGQPGSCPRPFQAHSLRRQSLRFPCLRMAAFRKH